MRDLFQLAEGRPFCQLGFLIDNLERCFHVDRTTTFNRREDGDFLASGGHAGHGPGCAQIQRDGDRAFLDQRGATARHRGRRPRKRMAPPERASDGTLRPSSTKGTKSTKKLRQPRAGSNDAKRENEKKSSRLSSLLPFCVLCAFSRLFFVLFVSF